MKVTIFGSGYVGLVTGACLAELGHEILCVDVDAEKIACLKRGESPIYEPGLTELLQRNIQSKRINFTTDVAKGVAYGTYQFIAVGTPPDEDGSADLKYVMAVARTIGEHLHEYRLVINKSTVPVDTADKVQKEIAAQLSARNANISFDVVSNPEFLKEGSAIKDFMHPDRIVVGADNEQALEKMRALYHPLIDQGYRFIAMNVRSAELTKYAANAFLATKISFMNEIAQLAERLGADVEQVRIGMSADLRIGDKFLYPGCGYGGSCFPKDVRALENIAEKVGYQLKILPAVEAVNQQQQQIVFNKINHYFKGNLQGKTIALWGLAFKPGTDDIREAPSRVLMEALWQAGANVQAYDPIAETNIKKLYGGREDLKLCSNITESLLNADVLAIVTEWPEFRTTDLNFIKEKLKKPAIFDGRNLYDPKEVAALGLKYFAIGRGDIL